MKRNLLYVFIAALAFSACKKDGLEKFEVEKSYADPAVNLEEFKKVIAEGAEGFVILLKSTAGVTYNGFIKTTGNGSANFVLDNNIENASTAQENDFRVATKQTNSVLQLGSTSKFGNFSKSVVGVDTTFSYKSTSGDTIKLVGDAYGSKLFLIKAEKSVADALLGGSIGANMTSINSVNTFKKYFKRFTTGGKSFDLLLNTGTKSATFTSLEGSTIVSARTNYVYTLNGIQFTTPLMVNGIAVTNLTNIVADGAASTISGKTDNGTFVISNEASPVAYNKATAAAFNAGEKQYSSFGAFTRDGVADAFNVFTIPDVTRLLLWTKYGDPYDLVGFTKGTSIAYGPAIVPTVTADGRIVYTYFGQLGTVPAAYAPIVLNVRTAFVQSSGFYVIQTSAGVFDLVSALDGRTWITFQ
jgi:hypothetical protein